MFEIGIEAFVGIQLRRITWQVEDFDAVVARLQPCFDRLGMVRAEIVEDDKDLAVQMKGFGCSFRSAR